MFTPSPVCGRLVIGNRPVLLDKQPKWRRSETNCDADEYRPDDTLLYVLPLDVRVVHSIGFAGHFVSER